ncbi:hypothetical protein PV939_12170, partial [Ligilactobacillus salivarius]|nr:hypothetical protein [Ligilactobacillus salivarius]
HRGGVCLSEDRWYVVSTAMSLCLNDTASTDIYTPSLHEALPIFGGDLSSKLLLTDTFEDMQRLNLGGTDQFFHCMAFCRVSKLNDAGVSRSAKGLPPPPPTSAWHTRALTSSPDSV